MIQAKTIFIIPGYKHSSSHSAYKRVANLLEKKGFAPIIVPIFWNKRITQSSENFVREFKKNINKDKYILGFSFGAIIAFLASTKVSVKGLVLCSLSPYFKEDLPQISKSDYQRIKSLYKDFEKISSKTIARQTKAKRILFLYGTREDKTLINRVEEAYSYVQFTEKHLLPIKSGEHDIGDKKYLNKIHKVIKLLN